VLLTSLAFKKIILSGRSVRTTNKNLYFGCNLSKSKKIFYREMAILFPVKREMAILFFVKRDPDPPLPPSNMFWAKVLVVQGL